MHTGCSLIYEITSDLIDCLIRSMIRTKSDVNKKGNNPRTPPIYNISKYFSNTAKKIQLQKNTC